MKRLKPIMFVGTGSDVGKSIVNAGFCRIFLQDGYSPAPFKAQNMSLNSYPTKDQLEIGRAQAVQAEACGLECTVDMNPILLKPTTNYSSQVVVCGKPRGNSTAKEYFRGDNRAELFEEAKAAFNRLSASYSPIVLEGAGSISEVNLWDKDIVNMRMAEYAEAATYLVADIDRGGVFASVYGSIMLLPEHQRRLIKGVIINKFRGDVSLFDDGRRIIEELTGVPVVGLLPLFEDIFIEQEDSVVLDKLKRKASSEGGVNIGVVLLRSISNFTDFNILDRHPSVNLFYAESAEQLLDADIVIIPGSKSTISDMIYLRDRGFVEAILRHYKAGKPIYGICGGYQIMGEMIYDPLHVEGEIDAIAALGILPVSTTIEGGKRTKQCHFKMFNSDAEGEGYEIHAGVTNSDSPLCRLDDGSSDGCYQSERCWGSYIHGIFDNTSVINDILTLVDTELISDTESYAEMKERNYNLLADRIREYVDMDQIYSSLMLNS